MADLIQAELQPRVAQGLRKQLGTACLTTQSYTLQRGGSDVAAETIADPCGDWGFDESHATSRWLS